MLMLYKLDETAAPFVNSGVGGAADLALAGTPPIGLAAGRYGAAPYFEGTVGQYIYGNGVSLAGVTSVSMSLWYWCWAPISLGRIALKKYLADNSWAAPYAAMEIDFESSTSGSWFVGVTTGAGTRRLLSVLTPYFLRTGVWCHLGLTYDGHYLKAYLNGMLVGTSADFNEAFDPGSGQFEIGGRIGQGTVYGIVHDLQVSNVERSASWFLAEWQRGMMMGTA